MNKLIMTAVSLICACSISAYADGASAAKGDVNGDGAVTITDVSKIAAHIKTKKMIQGESLQNADVNYDGKVNISDLSLTAAYIKGKKTFPDDPRIADETFKGYDAFLMFADGSMNWGNWNGQGYYSAPSFGDDADITNDGVYSVSITKKSITAKDDTGTNPSLLYGSDGSLLPAKGCTMLCVDITGLLDGTLAADGSELEGFLKSGNDANVNKHVKGKFRGDELNVTVTGIAIDGNYIEFDPSKIRYGNLDEEDNCYRICIADLLSGSAEDAAIDTGNLSFKNSITVEFSISGIDKNEHTSYDDIFG